MAAVVDSQLMLTASDGDGELSDAALRAVLAAKAPGGGGLPAVAADAALRCSASACGGDALDGLLARLAAGAGRVLLADCTAGDTAALHSRALGLGCGVALANKKPLVCPLPQYRQLTALPRRLRAESTVGAGMPVHAALGRVLAAGDAVRRVAGAFSGTLGVVMSGLEDGRPFSAVVADAKAAGYTEPDPRDDLSGLDVARKALILARKLGWPLELHDVAVESLYPPEMAPEVRRTLIARTAVGLTRFIRWQHLSVEAFMARLPELDAAFAARAEAAKAAGSVLRYAAVVEGGAARVGVQAVPASGPLGQLHGSDNLVEIHSDVYAPAPLVLQGRGAGAAATAAGVLADLLELHDCR